MIEGQAYEFVEVWQVQPDDERGQMVDRGLTPDICDYNDGELRRNCKAHWNRM